MKKLLIAVGLISFNTLSFAAPSDMDVGLCYGAIVVGGMDYKVVTTDLPQDYKSLFIKTTPVFQKLNAMVGSCMKGSKDDKVALNCINTLPTKADQDFMRGVSKGYTASDNAFQKGGTAYVTQNIGTICHGLK
ncbi:hypothetical protein G6710_09335 [Polynucleobacter paneuropaeus]|nr:hypothetical protein [Polynucleobacter paneuropaeus]